MPGPAGHTRRAGLASSHRWGPYPIVRRSCPGAGVAARPRSLTSAHRAGRGHGQDHWDPDRRWRLSRAERCHSGRRQGGDPHYGMHVIGFRDGFRGLMQNRFVRLDDDTLVGDPDQRWNHSRHESREAPQDGRRKRQADGPAPHDQESGRAARSGRPGLPRRRWHPQERPATSRGGLAHHHPAQDDRQRRVGDGHLFRLRHRAGHRHRGSRPSPLDGPLPPPDHGRRSDGAQRRLARSRSGAGRWCRCHPHSRRSPTKWNRWQSRSSSEKPVGVRSPSSSFPRVRCRNRTPCCGMRSSGGSTRAATGGQSRRR